MADPESTTTTNTTTTTTNVNKDDLPLGLAKGSVRSILALMLGVTAVIIGIAAAVFGFVNGTLDPLPIVMFVLGLAQVAVTFYFVQRNTGAQ